MKTIGSHMGLVNSYAENTMIAYQKAVEDGATALQVPIQITADGYVVCSHSPDISINTNGTGLISEINWLGYIDGLDAGYNIYKTSIPHYPYRGLGLTVPLFTDVLAEFKDQPVWIYAYDVNITPTDLDFTKIVYKLVKDAGMLSQTVFMWGTSYFSAGFLSLADLGTNNIASMYLFNNYADATASVTLYKDMAYDHKIKMVNITDALNADYVDYLHTLGFVVGTAALTDAAVGATGYTAKTKQYLDAGVDIILGDEPALMKAAFDEAGIAQTVPPPNGYYFRNNRNYDFTK